MLCPLTGRTSVLLRRGRRGRPLFSPHARAPSATTPKHTKTRRAIDGRDITWRVAAHWGQCTLFLFHQPTCHRHIVNENMTYSLIRNLLIRLPHTTRLISSSVRSAASALVHVFFFNSSRYPSASHACGGVEITLHLRSLAARRHLGSSDARLHHSNQSSLPYLGALNNTHHLPQKSII